MGGMSEGKEVDTIMSTGRDEAEVEAEAFPLPMPSGDISGSGDAVAPEKYGGFG